MKITIIAVGRMKRGSVRDVFESYKDRTPWDISVQEVEEKRNLPPKKLQERESELLLSAIPKSSIKIVLDPKGKTLSSEKFATKLKAWEDDGYGHISFLIGGADGHTDATRKSADLVLSIGEMTWPHMLMRVMLMEQLYRAYTIITSHPYHR